VESTEATGEHRRCALQSLNRFKVLSSNLQDFLCAVMLLLQTIIKAARYYNK
jgi:hypothetical protein